MFSGIVEAVQPILQVQELSHAIRITVQKPTDFNDLKNGDSISTNGVCLTVEKFDDQTMQFSLAAETLKVLRLSVQDLSGQRLNLERSLRFGDRIHGHLVTGHVETLGEIVKSEALGESWLMEIRIPDSVLPFVWPKGSITLHGVSLTVNSVEGDIVAVCLIPETLQRTNLKDLQVGHRINVEPDYFAKAFFRGVQMGVLK